MENLLLNDDILELEGIEYARENIWLTYKDGDNHPIPRVTKIIGQNRDQDYLIQWAANIGRRKYDFYRDKALTVGTIVHESIEQYLTCKYITHNPFEIDYDEIDMMYRAQVFSALESFKLWEQHLEACGCKITKIIGIEVPLFCPWFGGTADIIFEINGAVYIGDFKTSKAISPDYLIQAAAYMWIINNGYAPNIPHVNGIGIIRIDKNKVKFNDLFLNDFIPDQHIYITRLQEAFSSYLDSYYRTMNTNYLFDQYNSDYDSDKYFKYDIKENKNE